jgi:hypothetical protein
MRDLLDLVDRRSSHPYQIWQIGNFRNIYYSVININIHRNDHIDPMSLECLHPLRPCLHIFGASEPMLP